MADLIVYLDPASLGALLGEGARTVGRRVPIKRASLPPQIDRLDELSTLFLVTCERGRAVIVASLDEPQAGDIVGEATIHEHDITDLMVRLGCEKVWRVPEWASTPRIVPPNDVDLLRYTLGLPLAGDLPANEDLPAPVPRTGADVAVRAMRGRAKTDPMEIAAPTAEGSRAADLAVLRAAVYANPPADGPRRAYAARLRELGDPRGELIALQLTRVERGEPISDRERALLVQIGDACAEPLRPHLASYELHRGFVATCRLDREMRDVGDAVRADPAWATVEDIAANDPALLASPRLVIARTARIDGPTLDGLARQPNLLPYETLLPYPYPDPREAEPRGIVLGDRAIAAPLGAALFVRLRALCIDATTTPAHTLATSPLMRRLAHLDAWIDPSTATSWRTMFDALELPLLTLRFAVHNIEPVIAFERTDRTHRMRVELRATVSAEIAGDVARLVMELGRGLSRLDIVDTSLAPFAAQQPELIAALARTFPAIELRRGVSLALA